METNVKQEKLKQKLLDRRKFGFFLFWQLPMGWLAGLRLQELNKQSCVVSVPFKWLNKNPFKSMYFAVQSMAAEFSTAANCLLAIQGHQPSIAFILLEVRGNFSKKATGKVFFTCTEDQKAFDAVAQCVKTGEAAKATFKSVGALKDGTPVSEFLVTWSFKQRSS